ncbi:hypothetical protein Salat_2884100 [Sesamum alatum]|uniref:Uncharacterized protein n=1 Tax=Sesamum alatum TaxID=300844 RepID=A0AAE1XI51_9LAMI|nr:hypothetical protein Salat_2884100 [Sesamum alatum]
MKSFGGGDDDLLRKFKEFCSCKGKLKKEGSEYFELGQLRELLLLNEDPLKSRLRFSTEDDDSVPVLGTATAPRYLIVPPPKDAAVPSFRDLVLVVHCLGSATS